MTDSRRSLDELSALVTGFRDERDWARFHTPKNLAIAVVTEAAELAELYLWQEESAPPTGARLQRTAEEMADVLIYLLCMADVVKIDLADAVTNKLIENAKRFPADAVHGNVDKYEARKLRPTD